MEQQLLTLYAQVSREAARMQVYMLRAQKDGRPELVKIFRALECSHTAQANRLLMQLRGAIDNSEKNLSAVIELELPGFAEQYSALEQEAGTLDNKAITTGCNQAARITKMNINLAKQAHEGRRPDAYYICDFCGFIATDKRPDNCPICTATARRFIKVAK